MTEGPASPKNSSAFEEKNSFLRCVEMVTVSGGENTICENPHPVTLS